ncbi:MAG TPA: fatty acid oxidation complex subunit alpha FadJ [Gemmatimonadales bacterium]|nr:fatty acid oxidation complex subunit alpha FadJ [Gemmatimonadales bacterium]
MSDVHGNTFHGRERMSHFTSTLSDGVAVLALNVAGESVNVLSREVREEFAALIDSLSANEAVQAVILTSSKPDVFIAGADIDELRSVRTAQQAESLSREGQKLLDRVQEARFPIIAAIHGACLGGGLETALACSYRIASDHPKTTLGLPEIQLGLIPGAGGTQRLPRLIGLRAALDMILTGKPLRAKRALSLGVVDEVVHPSILQRIARERAMEFVNGTRSRKDGRPRDAARVLLDDNPVGRSVVLRKAREAAKKRSGGHYPAPDAAMDAIARGYADGPVRGAQEEARLFGELAVSPVARELMFLFRATTALKKDTGVDSNVQPAAPLRSLGVIGAGFMGAGIATIAVQHGVPVRMKDTTHQAVGKGMAAVRTVLRDRVRRRRMTRREMDDAMSLLSGTTQLHGFGRADIVVEAVFENLELKQQVLHETEGGMRSGAVYASNTSTIPISEIAVAARRPENVCGMHFFSPVHRMPLLEIVRGTMTSDETVVMAVAAGKLLGKSVIVVNDGPGFYTTRTLAAFLNEAGQLLDSSVQIEDLDAAMVAFGFPVGPVTLLDEVGLDVAGKVTEVLREAFGSRIRASDTLRSVLADGRTGRKGKKGFYKYDEEGERKGVDSSVYDLFPQAEQVDLPAEEIQERMVLALVNEAVRCLEGGILRSARDGDVGAVFGFGFPPFLGGPFRWTDSQGLTNVVRRMEALQDRFGERFSPAELLVTMAARGERFHPDDA